MTRTETTVPLAGLPQTIPFAQNAYSGVLTLPAAPSAPPGDTVTLVSSQTPFPNVPALQSAQRRPASETFDQVLMYFELTASGTTTLSGQPTFTVQLPAQVNPANGPFYVAFLDPTASTLGWNLAFEGPGTVSGSTLSFTLASGSLTLQAGLHYYYAVYQIVTPGAGATPMPLPNGSFSLTSTKLSIIGTGSSKAQQTTLQSPGYTGPYTESDNCSSIATVSMSSNVGPSSVVTVTGLAQGNCTATFSDELGQTASLSITVTVSGFFISSDERAMRHGENSRA